MKTARINPMAFWAKGLGACALVAGAWALSGQASQAQARDDVYWSIGVNSPGVSVGVSNAPTVVYGYPRHVYPVYPVYAPQPVVVYPRPVVVHSQPVYVQPRWHGEREWHKRKYKHGHGHGYGHGRGRDWDD